MRFTVACVAAILSQIAFIAGVHADAREELAKQVHQEISTRQMRCTVADYFEWNACGDTGEDDDLCPATMEAITDFKSELSSADTQRRAAYRWWKFVSSTQEKADCMKKLIGPETYCNAVNLAAKFDPRRNCPSDGTLNSTCWLSPNKRDWNLLPSEQADWTQRCKVDEPKQMEFEDAE
jgi:hypothetical protein